MPVNGTRAKKRDATEFDTTSLRANGGAARTLHRDYTAHFFRWSFARRLIGKNDHVLDLGCGVDQPLKRVLFESAGGPLANSYTGIDLNPLKASGNQHVTLHGETDFTSPAGFKKVFAGAPAVFGWDVIVHFEIIEHMPVEAGKKLLANCYRALKPGGIMIMSTPVYDGKRHAANHIHEYTVPELQGLTEKAKFVIEQRFGTFMDVKHIGRAVPRGPEPVALNEAVSVVKRYLAEYYDNDALSNIFGPLYPDHARNNLWVCRRPE